MQVLTPDLDIEGLYQRIGHAPQRVLMLDYDGTLAPFRVNPAEAVPYAGVVDAIGAIARAGGTRVVIVSGRPAREVPPLLAPAAPPEIWGAHGWERLSPDGRMSVHEPEPRVRDALVQARESVRHLLPHGARIEEKRASVALHWRGLPTATIATICSEAMDTWSPLARDADLQILPFDGGLELRARGCNKAYAVEKILDESDRAAAVAYLGDDITDEDAFGAVKPRGLAVLVRAELRETKADLWLTPPEELISFLRRWTVGNA